MNICYCNDEKLIKYLNSLNFKLNNKYLPEWVWKLNT